MSTSDDAQRAPMVAAPSGRASADPRTAKRPKSPGAATAPTAVVRNPGATPRTAPPPRRPEGGPQGRPQGRPAAAKPAPGAPRKVKLTVARVDPWSVMKLAFLLSVAVGIATVVAAAVLWTVLDGMGVFSQVDGMLTEILGSSGFDLFDYIGFGRIVSLATVVAVVNVVLLTAISTLSAFLYNIASSLVGGLHLTLSDD